jgi:hypothetical protein
VTRNLLEELTRLAEKQALLGQLDEEGAPQATTAPAEIMPPPAKRRRSRNREVTQRRIGDYSPMVKRMLSEWMAERVIPDPTCAVMVGCLTRFKRTLPNGVRMMGQIDYAQPTLMDDIVAFCLVKRWPAPRSKTLVGFLIEAAGEKGWVLSHAKAARSRRSLIRGIRLKGTPAWNGTEPGHKRYDGK